VRLEIRARFHAVETLQNAATTISAKAAALETRVRGAVEADVGQVRQCVEERAVEATVRVRHIAHHRMKAPHSSTVHAFSTCLCQLPRVASHHPSVVNERGGTP